MSAQVDESSPAPAAPAPASSAPAHAAQAPSAPPVPAPPEPPRAAPSVPAPPDPASARSEPAPAEPEPVSAPAEVVQDVEPVGRRGLREDFGAHVEANYQRLVAQLYAITLDSREAHDVVQDAYSRAWRSWSTIGSSPDPSAWVRRVAVRSTIRSWRRVVHRRPRPVRDGVDDRTGALLEVLRGLSAAERRCVVLRHMAGVSLPEIAGVEGTSMGTVTARLRRAELKVGDVVENWSGMALAEDPAGSGDHDAEGESV